MSRNAFRAKCENDLRLYEINPASNLFQKNFRYRFRQSAILIAQDIDLNPQVFCGLPQLTFSDIYRLLQGSLREYRILHASHITE